MSNLPSGFTNKRIIQTFLGVAYIRSASFDTKKARVFLSFPDQPMGLTGEQALRAKRIASASEPNTWIWTVGGIRGLSPETIIAENSKNAVFAYLAERA